LFYHPFQRDNSSLSNWLARITNTKLIMPMVSIAFIKHRLHKKQGRPSLLIRLNQPLPFEEKKKNFLFKNDCADREQLEKRKAQCFQQMLSADS